MSAELAPHIFFEHALTAFRAAGVPIFDEGVSPVGSHTRRVPYWAARIYGLLPMHLDIPVLTRCVRDEEFRAAAYACALLAENPKAALLAFVEAGL